MMDAFTATGMAEGWLDATEEQQIEAWQYLVDSGVAWQLQGWFGRQAVAMIDEGLITAPAVGNQARN